MAAGLLATAFVLASCGSDGPSALSPDDLASKADSICRTATKAIAKLDTSDPAAFLADSIDELSTASDELEALVPDSDSQADYDDFTASIAKQVKQAKKVATAVDDGDAAAISAALAKFTDLTSDSDDLADGLDATKCVGLGQAAVAAVAATTATTVPTTVPETVTPTTVAPVTLPPATLPPITTAPVTAPPVTVPPATVPPATAPPATTAGSGDTADGNLLDDWTAPPGYEFERETGDILVQIFPSPKSDPVLGPAYVRYDVGALGGPNATTFPIMMVLELSDKYTSDQISAYITFEGNDAGDTVDSPGGYSMWLTPASGDITFDSTMVFLGKYGITMRTDPGVDSLAIMDAFIAANFE